MELNKPPKNTAEPTHSKAPMPSNTKKRAGLVPTAPANALAIEAKPGTNLAINNDLAPQRVYTFSVFCTHESGDSEILQICDSTRRP